MQRLRWSGLALTGLVLAACGGSAEDGGTTVSYDGPKAQEVTQDTEPAPAPDMAQLPATASEAAAETAPELVSLQAQALAAPQVQVTLSPTDLDFPNPDRGFYRFGSDPAQLTALSAQYVALLGQRLMYTPADLSAFRTRAITATYLAQLDAGFAHLRQAGLKAVLRFAYNYPETDADYLNAQDATLSRVRSHLTQLQPVLQKNADVIAVMQAGFIGAWGEWHTSSNNLTTPANKAAVRDALLQTVPASVPLQVRYPADLSSWYPEPPTVAQWLTKPQPAAARIGQHNDCFLASPDDVGTYDADTPAQSQALRTYAQRATAVTGAGGETCAPPVRSKARMTCADILREGAAYHMTYLNRDYYKPFFTQWAAGGCLTEVSRKLGYRLELQTVSHGATATVGGALSWQVALRNQGWAQPQLPRTLVLYLVDAANKATALPLAGTDLRQAMPGNAQQWSGTVTLPASLPAGTYRVALGAPDAAPTLAGHPAYAVRFANADNLLTGVLWQPLTGRLALGSTVKVSAP